MANMDIDAAIEQLTKFKKMSKSLGKCDLVGLEDGALTVKVTFKNKDSSSSSSQTYRPVLGFSQNN